MVAPVVDYDFDLQQLADWQIIKSFKINLYEKKINADIRMNCKKYPKSRPTRFKEWNTLQQKFQAEWNKPVSWSVPSSTTSH